MGCTMLASLVAPAERSPAPRPRLAQPGNRERGGTASGRLLTEFSVRPPIPPDVFFELFEGKHGGMTWRYPISLKYLAERPTGPR